jgi:hypothetical protein
MLYRGYLPDFLVTVRMYFILSICPYIVPSWNRKHQKMLSYWAYVFSLCASAYNLHDVDTRSLQRMFDFLCFPIIKMLLSSDMLISISRKGQSFLMYFEDTNPYLFYVEAYTTCYILAWIVLLHMLRVIPHFHTSHSFPSRPEVRAVNLCSQ